MKTRFKYSNRAEGSVLLVTLLVAAIAGVTLASYLILTETQNVSVARSQVWNSSMALTEAGVEDALQLINKYAYTGDARDLPTWTNTAAADNWQRIAPDVYYVKRYLPAGGNFTNSYQVWVTNRYGINVGPNITAIGQVPWTYWYARGSGSLPLFGTILGTGSSLQVPIPRQVYVQTRCDSLFSVAMAAVGQIDLKGNNVQTDSFDSGDPNHCSAGGFYPTYELWKTLAHGDVCTDGAIINTLNVGNANIQGSVKTGPGTNTVTIGPTGSVGDKNWVQSGFKGIQTGHYTSDFNVAFGPVSLPEGTWLTVSGVDTNIDGHHYQYVITGDGNYTIGGLTSGLLVSGTSNSTVNILITDNVNLNGTDIILIENTGAKVRMYMEGQSFSLQGSAFIDNQSQHAQNYYLFGMETCTYINFGGNGAFYGGIYAPFADFALGGGGSGTLDFVGGSVSKTVSLNGHFNFHYDENLQRVGPTKGYVPINWREL